MTTSQDNTTENEIINELLKSAGEEDEANGPEEALLAICMAAQTDNEFSGATVLTILRGLDLEMYWKEAKELRSEDDEDVKGAEPSETPSDPEPEDVEVVAL